MRLIDADKYKHGLEYAVTCTLHDERSQEILKEMLMALDMQPTAYDPDKVVRQLEELRQISASAKMDRVIVYGGSLATYYGGEENAYEEAVKVVKGGAKDAD